MDNIKRCRFNNMKLKPDGILDFNLPPVETCPYRGSCELFCYGLSGHSAMTPAQRLYKSNYEFSLTDQFVPAMIQELNSYRSRAAVRPHAVGDYYSREYYNKWVEISRHVKPVVYSYTKSIPFIDWNNHKPSDNFRIVQSYGGRRDDMIDPSRPHCRIFSTLDELNDAGYHHCTSELPIVNQEVIKIGVVIHGNNGRNKDIFQNLNR